MLVGFYRWGLCSLAVRCWQVDVLGGDLGRLFKVLK